MPVFRRQQPAVPGARHGQRSTGPGDRSAPGADDAVVGLLLELDELRATVHRQTTQLRGVAAEVERARAEGEAHAQQRARVAVRALHDRVASDPAGSDDVRAFAARVTAAVARLGP